MDVQTLRYHLISTDSHPTDVPVIVYTFVAWWWYKKLNLSDRKELLDKHRVYSLSCVINLGHSDNEIVNLWAQFLMENNHDAP